MSKLDKLLSVITEELAQGMRMRCDNCGKITEIQDEGRGPLLCCDQKMIVMAQYTPKMEAGFNKYPRGWDNDSVKKFGKTLSKRMKGGVKSKGFFDKCVKKMRGKVENPQGFCAGVKDETYGSTGWRGKGKSPAKVKADTKKAKFKVEGVERILEYEEAYYIEQCDKTNDRIEDKLLCLKKAYILCGANKVCQQRIDRFYDAITGNFEGSGEAPLQTDIQKPDVQVIDPQMTRRNKLDQIMGSENFPDMSGGGGMGCRVPPADTGETEERDEDNVVHPPMKWSNNQSNDITEELNQIMELDPSTIATGFAAGAAATAGAATMRILSIRKAKKRCKQKYNNNPEKLKACLSTAHKYV